MVQGFCGFCWKLQNILGFLFLPPFNSPCHLKAERTLIQEWLYGYIIKSAKILPFPNAIQVVHGVMGGKGYLRDIMIGPFFPMKYEMANYFLVNHDFHSSPDAWFCKIIFRETRNKCLILLFSVKCELSFFKISWIVKRRFYFPWNVSYTPLYHPQYEIQ